MLGSLWARSFSLPPPLDPTRKLKNQIVDHLYTQFKHVMIVNDSNCPHIWIDDTELDLWCREHNCYYLSDRVWYDKWTCKWQSNGIGGADYFFIASDNSESFVLAQMVWG